jgi:hypothetical protein
MSFVQQAERDLERVCTTGGERLGEKFVQQVERLGEKKKKK